ncbi:MAG: TrmH family RNA methyltransferase [Bradymonadaceae bacterium]
MEDDEHPEPTGKMRRPPDEGPIEVGDLELSAATIVELLADRLTERRRQRIEDVLEHRTYHVVSVLDGLYDRGNVSAVLRSAEAMGFQSVHVVESQEHFKEANRVTQGADKWLDIERWERPESCIEVLRRRGYRICATDLDATTSIDEFDLSVPTAMVWGNEHDGVSDAVLEAADERVVLPIRGFVQSYNISVSAALCLDRIFRRRRGPDRQGDLTDDERQLLRAKYYIRSVDQPERLLRGLLNRQGTGNGE